MVAPLDIPRTICGRSNPAYDRAYRELNRDAIRVRTRRWHAVNRERVREAKAARYRAMSEAERTARRAYVAANRELVREIKRRYKLRRRNASAAHTRTEWIEKVLLFGGCCAYCGERRPLERDHRTPLVRGGDDSIRNIVPACRGCNAKKRAMTDVEYLSLRRAA